MTEPVNEMIPVIPDLPKGWTHVPESYRQSSFEIYRDTDAGRQMIFTNKDGQFEFMLQGYASPITVSSSFAEVLDAADSYSGYGAMRVANMDRDELSEFSAAAVWQAFALMSDPTSNNISQARAAISKVDVILDALRVRCAQKDPAGETCPESLADRYSAELRLVIETIYYALSCGHPDVALKNVAFLGQILSEVSLDAENAARAMLGQSVQKGPAGAN